MYGWNRSDWTFWVALVSVGPVSITGLMVALSLLTG